MSIDIEKNKMIYYYCYSDDERWEKIRNIVYGIDKVLKTKDGLIDIIDNIYTYTTDIYIKYCGKLEKKYKLEMKVFKDRIIFTVLNTTEEDKEFYDTILYTIKTLITEKKY